MATERQMIKEYRAIGAEDLGYEGDRLATFIEERIKEWRAEKAADRETQKELAKIAAAADREAQKELAKIAADKEAELAKISADRELAKIAAEQEQARLAHDLEIERLRVEGRTNGRDDPRGSSGIIGRPFIDHRVVQINMPRFNDKEEAIDDFLLQFEKLAHAHQVPEQHWAINVSAFLQGAAREVYHSLAAEEADDYNAFKRALLCHYRLTAETYRKLFRDSTKKVTETHSQFHNRVRGLFEKWIKMAEVDHTYDGLREIILKEHILGTYRRELTVFLAEREHKTLEEIASMAERYEQAHSKSVGSGAADRTRPSESRRVGEIESFVRNRQGDGKGGRAPTGKDATSRSGRATPTNNGLAGRQGSPTCFNCKRQGHFSRDCPKGRQNQVNVVARKECVPEARRNPANLAAGTVNGVGATILYDTGCSVPALVDKKYVKPEDYTGEVIEVQYANSTRDALPVAVIDLNSPYVKGKIAAACLEGLSHDAILGCRYVLPQPNPETCTPLQVSAVETRAMSKNLKQKPIQVTSTPVSNVLPAELRKLQQEDATLAQLHKHAEAATEKETPNGVVKFFYKKGILYRHARKHNEHFKQVVVPKEKRGEVMKLAHESLMGGHMGIAKTRDRLVKEFYWPGVQGDVKRFCLSCDKCQRMAPRTDHRPIPLGSTPLIDEPFRRVAIDLIGPIKPASALGNRYILTVVDYATRYPEAVALRNIDTETVAEALFTIWSRVGVPDEFLTNQGTQFMSHVMAEVNRLMSINHLTTTPYHPQCNGLVERFNGTLKHTLKKLCEGRPKDWDRYIPAMLFAYREVPQASLGFSPFELLYGRTVRGPIAVLRQLWTDDHAVEEVRTTYQYVADLRNKLEEVCSLAQDNLKRARAKQAKNYNKRAKSRQFEVGDKVLLLLPQEHNKLQVSWRGPYVVTEKVGGQTYRIQLPTKEKLYHANLLKRYRERETVSDFVVATIVTEDADGDTEGANTVPSCPLTRTETPSDVKCDPMLTEDQRNGIETLLALYADVLTEKPGRTTLVEFGLKLVDERPVQRKPYPLPHAKRQQVRDEIEQMINLGVIEPADSPYSSPVVLVQKKDGTHRFCVDYRKLNQVTEFQVEMLPDPEHIFASVSKARYFSKLDLSKGYWQIPVRIEDRPKLAFATPDGSYQWLVMPFGVQNAPSIFTKMMRKLLEPLRDRGVHNFMDDLLLATETWEEHLTLLADVLKRLRQEGLTARPSKCHLGFKTLDYLGHTLSQGTLSPDKSKVEQLRNAARPTTKTEVRSFLGLAGYYRRYVANFSAIEGPLSDLTRKRTPNEIKWTDACEHAFQTLKARLTSDAVVRLPDLDKEFVLRTDACNTGLGAVLLQEHNKMLFPVAYGSRKLSAAEKNYSVSERECLGIVFGISRFERYLYGRKFILETDHQPLAYLAQAKLSSGRLMRWSLFLQQYQMQIRYVKGSENVGADFMSRSAEMV